MNKNGDTQEQLTRRDELESSEEEEEEEDPEEVTQVPGNMLPHGIFRGVRDRMSRGDSSSSVIGAQDGDLNNALIPLVYRYYGRNRARTHTAGSIPFLLLGPNVDHWKVIGQQLAAKGFSVMTCERVQEENDEEASALTSSQLSSPLQQVQITRHSRVTRTLLTLLDALRWNRVVLVACDAESALAVEAALELAPDRVVGLVLCGNLDSIEPLINLYNRNNKERSVSPHRATGDTPTNTFHVDRFLKRHLACPFTIVWGGDGSPILDDDDDDNANDASKTVISTPVSDLCGIDDEVKAARRVILGAGSAPHRRRPEMFSWVLTRFVEEEIATLPPPSIRQSPAIQAPTSSTSKHGKSEKDLTKEEDTQSTSTVTDTPLRRSGLRLPYELQEFFSSQSFVVLGRVVAAALFYGMALKVGFYQYETLGANVRYFLRAPGKWRRKVFRALHVKGIWSFLRDKGVMPVLSRLKGLTRRILFFLPFAKDESQAKQPQKTANQEINKPEDDEIEPKPGDSNVEKPNIPEPAAEPTTPSSEEDEKSNHDGAGNDEEEEAKPGFKPFFLLDRVIA